MTIKQFAEKYRLRVTRDDCAEMVVPGKFGEIYRYSDSGDRFGVVVLSGSARFWHRRRRDGLTAGMQIVQTGDTEGMLIFNPADSAQAGAAIRMVGAKKRRKPTENQLATLEKVRAARFQQSSCREAPSRRRNVRNALGAPGVWVNGSD